MRVLIIAALPDSLINFRGELLREMVARGHEVMACAAENDPLSGMVDSVESKLAEIGVKYRPIPLSRASISPSQDLRTLAALRTVTDEFKPDKVLAYTMKAVVFGCWSARKSESYALITGIGSGLSDPNERSSARGKILRAVLKRALRRCKAVIFQNSDNRDFFKSLGLTPTGMPTPVVAGSGVDLARFQPVPLPKGPPVFLLIARLLFDKGIREYAAAAAAVRKQIPEAKFLLAGPIDADPRSVKKEEVDAWAASGDIEYLGSLTDVRPAIETCNVYVLPSYHEGMPRTVLEAMAMGRPIITTDAMGCRDTVIEGENGMLVRVADAEDLVRACLHLAKNKGQLPKMAQASLRLVREKFDVVKVNAAMLEIMEL